MLKPAVQPAGGARAPATPSTPTSGGMGGAAGGRHPLASTSSQAEASSPRSILKAAGKFLHGLFIAIPSTRSSVYYQLSREGIGVRGNPPLRLNIPPVLQI